MEKSNNGLIRFTTLESPASEALLKLIFCKCEKGCQKACRCRNAGSSQISTQISEEEEETDTLFEQTYNNILNQDD